MSEEKIARLREVFLETTKEFLQEQKLVENFWELPERNQLVVLISATMKLDDLLFQMCKLGISGAKLRGASSEEIERFMKELEHVSKKLRESMASLSLKKALFLLSQFQLLQRRIIKSVANMLSPKPLYDFSKKEAMPIVGKNVFIVHGRDDKPKLELARMLEKLGFNVIILSEQPDRGRTIIEKLEQETIDIGFAFVILTPDDIGVSRYLTKRHLAVMGDENLIDNAVVSKEVNVEAPFSWKNGFMTLFASFMRTRARQNVILELGYFVGKIGRDRVCCLYKGDVELPSDIHGVLFKKFDKSVEECYKGILDELKAAGYKI